MNMKSSITVVNETAILISIVKRIYHYKRTIRLPINKPLWKSKLLFFNV